MNDEYGFNALAKRAMECADQIINQMKKIRDVALAVYGEKARTMFPIRSDDDYEFMRIRLFESLLLITKDKLDSRIKNESWRLKGGTELVSAFAAVLKADRIALFADIVKPSIQPGLYSGIDGLKKDRVYGGILSEYLEDMNKVIDDFAIACSTDKH